jgi:hypothetical protein
MDEQVLAGRATVISRVAKQQENNNNDNNKPTSSTTSATAKSHKNSSSQRNGFTLYIMIFEECLLRGGYKIKNPATRRRDEYSFLFVNSTVIYQYLSYPSVSSNRQGYLPSADLLSVTFFQIGNTLYSSKKN